VAEKAHRPTVEVEHLLDRLGRQVEEGAHRREGRVADEHPDVDPGHPAQQLRRPVSVGEVEGDGLNPHAELAR